MKILTRTLEKNDFNEDKQIIQYLFKELEKLEHQLPTDNKLEELQKIVIDLEIKYDDFNDLVYYFDPLYVKIKKTIHEEKIKEIREEKKEREMKNNISYFDYDKIKNMEYDTDRSCYFGKYVNE